MSDVGRSHARRRVETLLTSRAADFLASGPADPQTLISHVCQLPGAPLTVAEHMAAALFSGHQRFARGADGRWCLREASSAWPAAATGRLELHASRSWSSTSKRRARVPPTATASPRSPWCACIEGVATTVFDSLINPERPIPPAITAITNITWSMVKDAPRFSEICDQLLGVLEGHVFVAHNASFDWRFIAAEVERATRRLLQGRTLCTVRLARRLLPQLARRNLDSVTAHYGIDIGARHRAGGDAEATAQVLVRLLEAARNRGCATLDDVDRLLAGGAAHKKRPRRPSSMPHSATGEHPA